MLQLGLDDETEEIFYSQLNLVFVVGIAVQSPKNDKN